MEGHRIAGVGDEALALEGEAGVAEGRDCGEEPAPGGDADGVAGGGEADEEGEGAEASDDDSSGDLTWTGFAKDFSERYCLECHTDPPINDADGSLETYDDWVNEAKSIKSEVVTFNNMPPEEASAFPTDEERALLGEWIDAGLPE